MHDDDYILYSMIPDEGWCWQLKSGDAIIANGGPFPSIRACFDDVRNGGYERTKEGQSSSS